MKVAIVHDFLMQMGGAEKVVEVLHELYPDAPIYTSAFDPKAMPAHYASWDIRTSFMQRLLLKKKLHRAALLLYPTAFESFDLSTYDLVISSSSAFAKGVITQPHTTHVCYTHSPMRYAWATASYVEKERIASPMRSLLAPGLHYLRTWDAIAAMRVDRYIANSSSIAQRIRKFYRREVEVVHPPVDTARFQIAPPAERGDYGILATRLVPYKRVDLAVQAFTRLGKPLKVVGSGRGLKELQEMAGPTIEFLGYVSDAELPGLIARAAMYLMPGEEDFGIAPVEANACGVPVVAYAAGGALDVQIDGQTGCLFQEPTVDSLCEAIERAYSTEWDTEVIRRNAMRFDVETFKEKIQLIVATTLPGNRRDRPIERRKGSVRMVPNERRQLVFRLGRPVWFDRRRHILGPDGVTVVGEQLDAEEATQRMPEQTLAQEVYNAAPKSVIVPVAPAEPPAPAPATATAPATSPDSAAPPKPQQQMVSPLSPTDQKPAHEIQHADWLRNELSGVNLNGNGFYADGNDGDTDDLNSR